MKKFTITYGNGGVADEARITALACTAEMGDDYNLKIIADGVEIELFASDLMKITEEEVK